MTPGPLLIMLKQPMTQQHHRRMFKSTVYFVIYLFNSLTALFTCSSAFPLLIDIFPGSALIRQDNPCSLMIKSFMYTATGRGGKVEERAQRDASPSGALLQQHPQGHMSLLWS